MDMNMKKNYLTGLLLVAAIACMIGCGNKSNSQTKTKEIWEYRTERYLDWIATDADLRLREAQEIYDEACKKQDSTKVREAEADLERVKSDRMNIIAYRCVFYTPSEEWTREDSTLMKQIYHFCRKAERNRTDHHISRGLVEYMQGLE